MNWYTTSHKKGIRQGISDRIVDFVVDGYARVTVIVVHITLFVIWGAWFNFDPYPYQFLNIMVSIESLMIALFVLINQKRQAQLSREHAEDDDALNREILSHVRILSAKEHDGK
jgi:uncharacterized membrane protein